LSQPCLPVAGRLPRRSWYPQAAQRCRVGALIIAGPEHCVLRSGEVPGRGDPGWAQHSLAMVDVAGEQAVAEEALPGRQEAALESGGEGLVVRQVRPISTRAAARTALRQCGARRAEISPGFAQGRRCGERHTGQPTVMTNSTTAMMTWPAGRSPGATGPQRRSVPARPAPDSGP
jgi:hypothetical protein